MLGAVLRSGRDSRDGEKRRCGKGYGQPGKSLNFHRKPPSKVSEDSHEGLHARSRPRVRQQANSPCFTLQEVRCISLASISLGLPLARDGREDDPLTRAKARHLRSEDGNFRAEERLYSRLDRGHIPRAEQGVLNQEENRVSRQIYNEEH